MAQTSVLGTANSLLGGSIFLGYGAEIPQTVHAAEGALTLSDAASSNIVVPVSYSGSASDSASFTDASGLSPSSQTMVGWIQPVESWSYALSTLTGCGVCSVPNGMIGVNLNPDGKLFFDAILSDEYDGSDLLFTVFWTSQGGTTTSGTLEISVIPGQPTSAQQRSSPVGTEAFANPATSSWVLQETTVVVTAASLSFALAAGNPFMLILQIANGASFQGSVGATAYFVILGIEIQNR